MNELELLNGTEEIIPENIITKEQFVKFVENSVKFEELMMMYRCAIREVQTKLEILNDEFKTKRQRNPIDSIRSRIKSPLSIYEKLKRRNYPVSIQSIADNLNDVAGIRVVCPFISDIYDVARMLISQDDVEVMEVKDYPQTQRCDHQKGKGLHYEQQRKWLPQLSCDRVLYRADDQRTEKSGGGDPDPDACHELLGKSRTSDAL